MSIFSSAFLIARLSVDVGTMFCRHLLVSVRRRIWGHPSRHTVPLEVDEVLC